MRTAIIHATILFVPAIALSATIVVPDDYTTIQAAINAARKGDTVLVKPGTYKENINFKGKAIAVRSEQGAEGTFIDGQQTGSVVTFASGEGNDSVLQGFTVTNGSGTTLGAGDKYGGGIYCTGASPVILDNTITGNETVWGGGAYGYGGGIYCSGSPIIANNTISENKANDFGGGIYCIISSTIKNNVIRENEAGDYGGGIYCRNLSPTIENNVIIGNAAGWIWSGDYGGIDCDKSSPMLSNNTIAYNVGLSANGGVHCGPNTSPIIVNSILWGNSGLQICGSGNPTVTHSDVQGGYAGTGNIDADPRFVNPANGDFHLTYLSPCRDAGDNSAVTELTDFEGDPRVAHGTVDMGADEFYTHLYYTGDATPGGSVELKFVDLPCTSPVGFWIASNVLEHPIPGAFGDWWLLPPMTGPFSLPPIPSNGVYVLPGTIPASPPGPYNMYLQAIMGTPSKLTNLCVIAVN